MEFIDQTIFPKSQHAFKISFDIGYATRFKLVLKKKIVIELSDKCQYKYLGLLYFDTRLDYLTISLT